MAVECLAVRPARTWSVCGSKAVPPEAVAPRAATHTQGASLTQSTPASLAASTSLTLTLTSALSLTSALTLSLTWAAPLSLTPTLL